MTSTTQNIATLLGNQAAICQIPTQNLKIYLRITFFLFHISQMVFKTTNKKQERIINMKEVNDVLVKL